MQEDLIAAFDISSTLVVDRTYRSLFENVTIKDVGFQFQVRICFNNFNIETKPFDKSHLPLANALIKNLIHLSSNI